MGIQMGHTRHSAMAEAAGWREMKAGPHLCFPPRTYPAGASPSVPGARGGCAWECPTCLTYWRAVGTMCLNGEEDWPGGKSVAPILGPEMWRCERPGNGKVQQTIIIEHDMYDFRGLQALMSKYWRLLLDERGVDWSVAHD